ncbi:MAG: hypothetical protein A2Z34_02565 [Planctomycetes bacterium RBG_16_59_8]|nr:MAG: hypothetical protein A2Z34_02565 [Planctomycetes bacterium RBG_16_59_8]
MKRHLHRFCAILLMIAIMPFSSCDALPDGVGAAKAIPIQHRGRIKSLEAFSREVVKQITGREKFDGRPAILVILDAAANPSKVGEWKWIRIDDAEMKAYLGLPILESTFSDADLAPSLPTIHTLVRQAQTKRDSDLPLTQYEQRAETIFSQIHTVRQIQEGSIFALIPAPAGGHWGTLAGPPSPLHTTFAELLSLHRAGDDAGFRAKTAGWIGIVRSQSPEAADAATSLEIIYYRLPPFQISWIAYLASFVLLTFFGTRPRLRLAGLAVLVAGILFHSWGLLLRVLILDRPPVSNMYESMVFMNWILMLIAILFAAAKRNLIVLKVGALVSALVMIYSDLLPIDADMNVLVPVLRSNYWLTIHVLTIVASYGVLALAMGLGHRFLILDALGRFHDRKAEEASATAVIRTIQLGALLLGIGTVLGGIWANESWGRFWGWDPKETWALITFLGYLVIIHLRATGRLGNFGLAVGSIVNFLLVLMTWYGVNFVLGQGLHSYGFGAGGLPWVLLYVALECLFTAFVVVRKLLWRKAHGQS